MQEIKPIRVFLEVAAQRSFARAAKSLQMTPATVTRLVAQLESDLGQQLLLRTTRKVSLTPAGAIVAASYRPLITEFDRVSEELNRQSHPNRGRLAINAPLSFGMRLMPGLIDSFRLAYPNVEVVVQMTDRLVDIVLEECDLAIRLSDPPEDKSTIWRRVCDIPRVLVASTAFLDLHGQPDSPDDLDRSVCLSYGHSGERETWRFRRAGAKRTVTAGNSLISNNGDFLYALVQANAGMAVLPHFFVDQGLRDGSVAQVFPDWTLPPLTLSLFYPPYEALPPLVGTFTDFFEAFLADLDGFDFG